MKNLKEVLKAIVDYRLDHKRVNDLHLSDDVLTIGLRDWVNPAGKTETLLNLVNAKSMEYGLTVGQLAGLRIANGVVTSEWAHEFKEDAAGSNFQSKAREIMNAGGDLGAVKLKVVKQLKIRNNQIQDKIVPVYRNDCYSGYATYFVAARAAGAMPSDTKAEKDARNLKFNEAYDALRKTAVLPGKEDAKNYLLLPVFEVI